MEDARSKIMSAATHLFAEQGFGSTSVREIAKKAKVNVAMICYYYCGKEELYTEIIKQFARRKTEVLQNILIPANDVTEFEVRLKLFLQTFTANYMEDKHLVKMFLRESQSSNSKLKPIIYEHFRPVVETIKTFFEAGVKSGFVRSDLSVNYGVIMLLGSLIHPVQAEFGMENLVGGTLEDKYVQKEYTETLTQIILRGVLK